MKRYLPFLIVMVAGLLTIGGGAVLYRAKLVPTLTAPASNNKTTAEGSDSKHVRGPANASVTLEEFGDFQCPPCGTLSDPLNKVVDDYKGKVRLIFHEFPLINHQFAKPAAYAAEAAGRQGKFWEMHDLLYRTQNVWTKADDPAPLFANYAKMLGLDPAKFEKDSAGEAVKERVSADQKRAAELGVSLTPTVFVNGKSIAGPAHNPQGLRNAIDAALSEIPAQKK